MAKTTKAMRFFPKPSVLLVSWLLVMLNNADMAAAAPFHNPVNYSESSPRLQTAVYSERRPVLRKVPWNIYYAVFPSIHPGPHQMDSLSFSQKVCVFHCVLAYTKGESLLKTIHFIKSRINHNPWSYLQRCISIRVCTLESLRRKNCLWRTVMHGVSNMTPQQIAELHRVLAQALEIRLWKDILLFLQDKDFQIISNRYRNCSSARSSCMSQPNGSLFGNIIAGKPWSSDSGKEQFFRLVHIRYIRYKSGVFLAGKFQSEAKTKPTGIPSGRRFSVAGGNKPLNIVNNQKSSIVGYRKTADAAKNRWPANSSNRTERTFLIKQIFAAANNKASNITGNQQYSATLNMKTTRNQQPSSGQEPVSLTTNPQTMIVANYKAQDGVLNMILSTTAAYKAAGVTTNQQYSATLNMKTSRNKQPSSGQESVSLTTNPQTMIVANYKAQDGVLNMIPSTTTAYKAAGVTTNQQYSATLNMKTTRNQQLSLAGGDRKAIDVATNRLSLEVSTYEAQNDTSNQQSSIAGIYKAQDDIINMPSSKVIDNEEAQAQQLSAASDKKEAGSSTNPQYLVTVDSKATSNQLFSATFLNKEIGVTTNWPPLATGDNNARQSSSVIATKQKDSKSNSKTSDPRYNKTTGATTDWQSLGTSDNKASNTVTNQHSSVTVNMEARGNQQSSVSSVRKTIRVTTILQSAVNVNNKALNDTINMFSASGDNNSTSVIANQHSSVRFNKKATSNQLLLVGDKTERSCYNNQKSSNKTRCKTTVNVTNQPSYAAVVTKVTGIINHRQFSAIGDNTPIGTFNNSKPFSQSYILSSTSRNQLLQSTGDNNENRLLTADKNTSNTTEENGDTLPDKSKFSKNESEGKSVTAIDSLSSKSTVTDNPVNIFSRSETEKPYSSSSTQFFNYLQSVSSKSNHSPDSKEKEQEEEKEEEEEEEEEET